MSRVYVASRSGGCRGDSRSGDDDFSVDELLVKLGVLALLVRGGDKGVSLVLEPLADAELVLGGAQKLVVLRFGGAKAARISGWNQTQMIQ